MADTELTVAVAMHIYLCDKGLVWVIVDEVEDAKEIALQILAHQMGLK